MTASAFTARPSIFPNMSDGSSPSRRVPGFAASWLSPGTSSTILSPRRPLFAIFAFVSTLMRSASPFLIQKLT